MGSNKLPVVQLGEFFFRVLTCLTIRPDGQVFTITGAAQAVSRMCYQRFAGIHLEMEVFFPGNRLSGEVALVVLRTEGSGGRREDLCLVSSEGGDLKAVEISSPGAGKRFEGCGLEPRNTEEGGYYAVSYRILDPGSQTLFPDGESGKQCLAIGVNKLLQLHGTQEAASDGTIPFEIITSEKHELSAQQTAMG